MCRMSRRQSALYIATPAAFVCLFALAPPVAAQTSPAHEFANWNAVLTSASLTPTPGPTLWFDLHARRGEAGTVFLVRPGAGFQFTPWLSAWAGYAWIPTLDDASDARTDEHRLWQQLILTPALAPGLGLQSRTRLEQRLGEGRAMGHRIRQFVRVDYRPESLPVGLVAWDELFLGVAGDDWGPKGYDQNRLFLGVALPVSPAVRLEGGYLLVHLDRAQDRFVHALAVNLFLSAKPNPSD